MFSLHQLIGTCCTRVMLGIVQGPGGGDGGIGRKVNLSLKAI